MIQIIGWMLCVYLIVKGCELIAMPTASPKASTVSMIGAAIALIAAPIFLFMLNAQAESGGNSLARTQSYSDCIRDAETVAEMTECRQ